MDLEQYAQYREKKQHARNGFAYNTYICTIPLDFARVGTHWHDEMEIIYIKKGAGAVTVDLVRYPVAAGGIVLVLPGQLHAIEGRRGIRMEYENIIFSLSMLDTPQSDWCRENCLEPLARGRLCVPTYLAPTVGAHDAVAAALDAADHACAEAKPGYPLRVKSELFRLLDALYSASAQAGGAPRPRPAPGTARLKTVLAWAEEHLAEPVTVADAAKIACYSPAHFMRFFRAGTGQSFVEYLTEQRLTAAARALAETDAPIGVIAQRTGFETSAYFCRRFKARYGASPRAWRRAAGTQQAN